MLIGEAEEETRVAARSPMSKVQSPMGEGENHPGFQPPLLRKEGSGEPETEIFSISPTLMFVKAGYVAAAVGALFLAAVVSVFLPTIVSTWVAVLFGLMLFLIPAFYHFKQKLVDRFEARDRYGARLPHDT